ncbi:hypothetical protein DPSP01_000254 [Paraphaeosphaeria sporulosa]
MCKLKGAGAAQHGHHKSTIINCRRAMSVVTTEHTIWLSPGQRRTERWSAGANQPQRRVFLPVECSYLQIAGGSIAHAGSQRRAAIGWHFDPSLPRNLFSKVEFGRPLSVCMQASNERLSEGVKPPLSG